MISPELLRRFPLFAGQSYYMLQEIAILADRLVLEQGEWLIHEGEPATKLYLVLEGGISLCLFLYLNGANQHIEVMDPLGKGEAVGWSSLVKPHIYTLGAIATKRSELVAIDAASLRELLDDNPQFGYHLLKHLSEVIGDRLMAKCIQLLSIVLDKEANPIRVTV